MIEQKQFIITADPRDRDIVYKWYNVGMLDYDFKKDLYLVMKVNEIGRLIDDNGAPVINRGHTEDGKRSSLYFTETVGTLNVNIKFVLPYVYITLQFLLK